MKDDEKTVSLFNPLNTDFSVQYDIDGTRNPKTFTIKAKEIKRFEPVVAEHIGKHLADKVFDVRGNSRKDRQPQIDEFLKEIKV